MLYLGYILLRYVLIYNLKVSFNFSLDVSTIKCDQNVHCAVKTVIYLTLGQFLRTPDNSHLFSISLKGSSYRASRLYLYLHARRTLANVSSDYKHLTPNNTISFQNLLIMIHSLKVSLYLTLTFKICHNHIYLYRNHPSPQLLPVRLTNISNALS